MRIEMRPAEAMLFHDRAREAEALRAQADGVMVDAVAAICSSHGATLPPGAPRLSVAESGAAVLEWPENKSDEGAAPEE